MTPLRQQHQVGERVQLLVDVPNMGLQSGDVGSVCSIWEFASETYEVEFRKPNQTCAVRALVTTEEIEAERQQ